MHGYIENLNSSFIKVPKIYFIEFKNAKNIEYKILLCWNASSPFPAMWELNTDAEFKWRGKVKLSDDFQSIS